MLQVMDKDEIIDMLLRAKVYQAPTSSNIILEAENFQSTARIRRNSALATNDYAKGKRKRQKRSGTKCYPRASIHISWLQRPNS